MIAWATTPSFLGKLTNHKTKKHILVCMHLTSQKPNKCQIIKVRTPFQDPWKEKTNLSMAPQHSSLAKISKDCFRKKNQIISLNEVTQALS